jgi:hypothetical protein
MTNTENDMEMNKDTEVRIFHTMATVNDFLEM